MPLSKPTAPDPTASASLTSQTSPLWNESPPKGPIRVGLVGTGYIADYHVRALRGIKGVELVAVADQSRLRAVSFAREHGVAQAYGSLSEMLRGDVVDAVHILTPPDTHADVAIEAVEADIDVLLEKPLDVQSQKAAALCELAERRRVALAVSHNFLFSEPYARLRDDVRAGRLGPIDSVTITWHRELGFVTQGPYDVWMLRDPANIMLEVGVHSIAHAWDLLGPCGNWQVDASNPKLLPTGATFFRRWSARTDVGRAQAELNFSFVPGATQHTIHVRGSFGMAMADLENNTYTLDRLTPHSLEFDRFFRQRRRGASLAAQAGRNLGRHVLAKLKLAGKGNAYGASIAASVAEFYGLLRGEQSDNRIAARFACDVVTAAEQIGQLGARVVSSCSIPVQVASPAITKTQPRVLVLGGSGFIGREVVSLLLQAGQAVRVLVRKPAAANLDQQNPLLQLVAGDLRRPDDLRNALDGIERVCHLARPAAKTWQEYQDQDVEVTRQIGRLCLEKQIKRLVYTGTIDSLYLGRLAGTITDKTPLDAEIERRNYYSRAKAAGEELLLRMHQEQSLPLVVLRPAIVIGRDGSPCHWGVGKWNGLGVVELWGRGENPLPLVLVQDVAAAAVAALEKPQIEGRIYNLSSPSLLTAREYVRAIEGHAGVEIQTFAVPIWRHYLDDRLKWVVKKATRHPDGARTPNFRDWDCRSQQAIFDCSGACRDLDWKPTADRGELIRWGIHEPIDRLFR
jgi:predicted dehydrogenase/nucleoside-diphosphate-sugar epimerase